MKIVKRSIRYVVSKRVSKNHLFEQPQERERHPPVQLTRPERNDAVCLSSIESVSEDILGSKGFLLVHHWATWCDGCMEELDDIQRFVESLQEESIPTYAVSWELFNGTPPQNALPVVQHVHEAHKLTFSSHIVRGNPEDLFASLALQEHQIPQTSLYKDGRMIFSHLGVLQKEQQEEIQTHIRETP